MQNQKISGDIAVQPSIEKKLNFGTNPLTGLIISIVTTTFFVLTNIVPTSSFLTFMGLCVVAWLAAENGGNDVSKGVSSLVASGYASALTAIIYGVIMTAIGGVCSFFLASKLVGLFTAGLMSPDYQLTGIMALAMALGATLWVALATKFSLPVSTTHAIIGAVILVACISQGVSSVLWGNLGSKFVLPLLLSPVLGLCIAWLLNLFIDKIKINPQVGKGIAWISSGLICFVRSVNDTPKIVAIALLVSVLNGSSEQSSTLPFSFFILVTVAMSLGSLIKGLPVTELLAKKVTKLDENSSLSAVFTTTSLVMASSQFGLPASTTHVSTSSIIGAGLKNGRKAMNFGVIREIILSWVVTLPGAGIIAMCFYFILNLIL
ncbi:inorganic phosphate transporter [Priestia megaterium]|jgi:phosphate/sulfate permease|uniref:inorganic phosphate transporter n=1 Tax=Priestia megaterium TaxID=1404 RepID=UPI00277DCCA2|nr:inorganic phosphate transporter [Priestia megaterium]MDQ0808169.1 PiT family inorganic phosphate transporter [Priestia megaterium]